MKILLLAGEESGLVYADMIRGRLGGHEVRGYSHYGFDTADLAVMGFGAVIRRFWYFLRVKRTMERAIDEWRPDVVCGVDYPGMNLKLAAYAKRKGIRTVHAVCPQVWAWKAGRIPKIEASLDRLCCFFPFEPGLFKKGFAKFTGHPLAGETFEPDGSVRVPGKKLVAILPGSRIGEIEKILPVLLDAFGMLGEEVAAVIPAANAKAEKAIEAVVSRLGFAGRVAIRKGGARGLLAAADCAAVASGTATLEAAFAGCPSVLVYRVGALLAWFARRVIKGVKHVGLVNIIAEKSSMECPMPELLQEDFTAAAVAEKLSLWLNDAGARDRAAADLRRTAGLLKAEGDAVGNIVANLI